MSETDAATLRDKLSECEEVTKTFVNDNGNVYVELEEMIRAERALTIGYDCGYTPNGMIDSVNPAFRLKPRNESEYDV